MLEKPQTFPQPKQNRRRSAAQSYDVISPGQNKSPAHAAFLNNSMFVHSKYLHACNLLKTEHRKAIITPISSNQIVEGTNTMIIKRKIKNREKISIIK